MFFLKHGVHVRASVAYGELSLYGVTAGFHIGFAPLPRVTLNISGLKPPDPHLSLATKTNSSVIRYSSKVQTQLYTEWLNKK